MKSQSKNAQYLVAYGNLYEGFTFVGPFDSFDAAIHYAEQNAPSGWAIYALYPPDSSTQED